VTTPYQQAGDKVRCLRHSTTFDPRAAESCPGCADDPGDEIAAPNLSPSKPPKGCMSTEAIERWYVEQASDLTALRRQLTAPKKTRKVATGKKRQAEPVLDLHALNTVAKLSDAAIKCMRAAAELAARREDEDLVRQREQIERARERNVGAAH
jgi:hypothetical protein